LNGDTYSFARIQFSIIYETSGSASIAIGALDAANLFFATDPEINSA
jgi:hypothetical protein